MALQLAVQRIKVALLLPLQDKKNFLEYGVKDRSLLLFLIGIFYNVRISLVGQLYFGELILLFVAIFLIQNFLKLWKQIRALRLFLRLFFIGFFTLLVSNYVNGASFEGSVKGIASQIFFLTSFIGLTVLLKDNLVGVIFYFVGKAIGNLFFYEFVNVDFTKELGDKAFEVYYATSLSFFVLASIPVFIRIKIIQLVILLSFGVICILYDARSFGLTFVLTSIIGALSWFKFNLTRTKLIVLASIFFPLLAFSFYSLGKHGYLGKDSYKQFNMEVEGNPLSLMSRGETVIGFLAWKDRPIFGHGSYAPGAHYYAVAKALGIVEEYVYERPVIPSHSVIIGSAVEAGIFAAITWIYLFFFFAFLLVRIWQWRRNKYFTIIAYFVFSSLWGLMFSPFGFARLHVVAYLGFVMAFLYEVSLQEISSKRVIEINSKSCNA